MHFTELFENLMIDDDEIELTTAEAIAQLLQEDGFVRTPARA